MINRIDLTRSRRLRQILRWRALQPALMLVLLAGFILAILTGLVGTPAGSHNFGIIFVWIVWWALLIILMIPFFGRMWCAICPIPGPGEWLQRRGILHRAGARLHHLGWRWPKALRNIWLQNLGFLGVALFSTMILTRPSATAWVLLGMIILSTLLSIAFKNRVFCRYVCPVGGFIGLYALTSSVELRVKDREVCRTHKSKDCITGNDRGPGCPWMVYPGKLDRNAYCGLCTACVKTCPKDNVALRLRPFGTDLLVANGRRLDEAYKAIIMLSCAALYSAVLLGPWGWVKDWANMVSLKGWATYAGGFLALNLLLVPALFALTASLARRLARFHVPLKQLFIDYAYSLVPMGLSSWVAFSLGFVFVNGSYAASVLSDPFGWGWNLLGTRGVPWTPAAPQLAQGLQVMALLAGLLFSIRTAYRIGRQHATTHRQTWLGTLPVAGFLCGATLVLLRLYLG